MVLVESEEMVSLRYLFWARIRSPGLGEPVEGSIVPPRVERDHTGPIDYVKADSVYLPGSADG